MDGHILAVLAVEVRGSRIVGLDILAEPVRLSRLRTTAYQGWTPAIAAATSMVFRRRALKESLMVIKASRISPDAPSL